MTTAQTQFSATLQTVAPDVSIVIPTCNRPDLVGRAVRSVLQQTLRALEVIVVVDGGSEATVERLEAFEDRRLRTVVLAKRSGPAVARNVGVAQARAEWVSFLDDDDEMLPDRIAKQLAAARASSARYPVVACRYYVQSQNGRYVYPDLLPEQTTEVSEYLFDRRGITGAIGGLGTSSILVKRGLLRHVPYPDLPRHEDWGWALEASRHAGWELRVIAEPLTIVHIQAGVSSISRPAGRRDWRVSLHWARSYRKWITARAYASFLLVPVARMAREDGNLWAAPCLLAEALRFGRPRLNHLALFCAIWLLPKRAQELPYALRRYAATMRSMQQRRQATGT